MYKNLCVTLLFVFFHTNLLAVNHFFVGQGSYDITGPAAELGMVGYGNLEQQTNGIHTRLRARSFVISDSDKNKYVAITVIDTAMITHSIKQAVIDKLQSLYGDRYNHDNVLINATHTHAGPGGFSYYALYSITAIGFNDQNFTVIVDGIVNSIKNADSNLRRGNIKLTREIIDNAGVNRSSVAYDKNPAAERANYADNINKEMLQLNFFDETGSPLGLLNWFGVHAVSMTQENQYISGDNKGYAAYQVEQAQAANYNQSSHFVAAFAQSEGGDVSPNLNADGTGPTNDEFVNTQIIGQRQADKAITLMTKSGQLIGPSIDFKHRFVDMSAINIDTNNGGPNATCTAALGYAFAAGAEDGPGPSFFEEGQLVGNFFIDFLAHGLLDVDAELKACHAPKPILIATGNARPFPWTPNILPISLLRIGELLIVGLPAEVTTMAARRIKTQLSDQFNGTIDNIIVAGLSNHYSGYITTFEEYQSQQYEGGHTLFGPHTLAAYQQELGKLAQTMIDGSDSISTVRPPDLSDELVNFQPGVVFDSTPWGRSFGDVRIDVNSSYPKGATVTAHFWTGHPKNDLKTQDSYLEIQQLSNGRWQTIRRDYDWDTFYQWNRINGLWGTSEAIITWKTPSDVAAGEYRIIHKGAYKSAWNRRIYNFEGQSSRFTIQ